MAAEHWGGKHEARRLKDALPGSYEHEMHEIQRRHLGGNNGEAFYFNTGAFADVGTQDSDNRSSIAVDIASMLRSPSQRLQRWVGVCYKPRTERQSHYGELALQRCYDQVVFVDSTSALAPIKPRESGLNSQKKGKKRAAQGSNKRLFKEYSMLRKNPPPGIEAHPLEDNILKWHYVLTPSQAPYAGGQYHGTLTFPQEYPSLHRAS